MSDDHQPEEKEPNQQNEEYHEQDSSSSKEETENMNSKEKNENNENNENKENETEENKENNVNNETSSSHQENQEEKEEENNEENEKEENETKESKTEENENNHEKNENMENNKDQKEEEEQENEENKKDEKVKENKKDEENNENNEKEENLDREKTENETKDEKNEETKDKHDESPKEEEKESSKNEIETKKNENSRTTKTESKSKSESKSTSASKASSSSLTTPKQEPASEEIEVESKEDHQKSSRYEVDIDSSYSSFLLNPTYGLKIKDKEMNEEWLIYVTLKELGHIENQFIRNKVNMDPLPDFPRLFGKKREKVLDWCQKLLSHFAHHDVVQRTLYLEDTIPNRVHNKKKAAQISSPMLTKTPSVELMRLHIVETRYDDNDQNKKLAEIPIRAIDNKTPIKFLRNSSYQVTLEFQVNQDLSGCQLRVERLTAIRRYEQKNELRTMDASQEPYRVPLTTVDCNDMSFNTKVKNILSLVKDDETLFSVNFTFEVVKKKKSLTK